jgi:hypothetical protein
MRDMSFVSSLALIVPKSTQATKRGVSRREIRNPKLEIRNKFKTRNPKLVAGNMVSFFVLPFGFVSDFELRISNFRE